MGRFVRDGVCVLFLVGMVTKVKVYEKGVTYDKDWSSVVCTREILLERK